MTDLPLTFVPPPTMAKTCRLVVLDEVNVRFEGLDIVTRKQISNQLKYMVPGAKFQPSYKLKRWDGYIRFFDAGGRTYLNLADRVLPMVEAAGYRLEMDDRRQHPDALEFAPVDAAMFGGCRWPEGHTAAGQEVRLRDDQVTVINHFLANPQCIQEVATGAGKTLICAALSRQCEQHGRTLIIVPSTNLVRQTEQEYRNLGLDTGVYRSGTDDKQKEKGRLHTIITWQTLNSLKKHDEKHGRAPLADFGDLKCVIVDEAHTSKNSKGVLRQLLCDSLLRTVPIRWGLTGTVPKEDAYSVSLISGIGRVVHRLSARELQAKGILSQCNINIMRMQDGKLDFGDYHEEQKFLTTDAARLDYIAAMLNEVRDSGNMLVLVDKIKTGEMLCERMPESVFVHGKMKAEERKQHYDAVDGAETMTIVATYGVAAVGINIPRIFNVVLFEPGRSFVRVLQSIGRGIRKARDRDTVTIWDLTSTCKFSARHLKDRRQYYRAEGHPCSLHECHWRDELDIPGPAADISPLFRR